MITHMARFKTLMLIAYDMGEEDYDTLPKEDQSSIQKQFLSGLRNKGYAMRLRQGLLRYTQECGLRKIADETMSGTLDDRSFHEGGNKSQLFRGSFKTLENQQLEDYAINGIIGIVACCAEEITNAAQGLGQGALEERGQGIKVTKVASCVLVFWAWVQ